jgi:poly(hydroxyalkanoate) depolymerase family esterase
VLSAIRQARSRIGAGQLPNLAETNLPQMDLLGMNLPGLNVAGVNLSPIARSTPPPIPYGAEFVTRAFSNAAGSRTYKLYIPACAHARPLGLVVMLHGCKQNPDDFARGTGMNAVAERHGLLVAYPTQPPSANASACWNWFSPGNQRRDAGEPAMIAGITRQIMAAYALTRSQVFVAGLSAGGAMAAVMAETYPDLYAAVGIHSGLPYGVANDVVSAFAAMRGEGGDANRGGRGRRAKPLVRTIVFHGGADSVVHPSNGKRIVAATRPEDGAGKGRRERISGGGQRRSATRTVIDDAMGDPIIEYWVVDGAGHAWSGGDSGGSYTDRHGPDASAEMVRFFLNEARAIDRGVS